MAEPVGDGASNAKDIIRSFFIYFPDVIINCNNGLIAS